MSLRGFKTVHPKHKNIFYVAISYVGAKYVLLWFIFSYLLSIIMTIMDSFSSHQTVLSMARIWFEYREKVFSIGFTMKSMAVVSRQIMAMNLPTASWIEHKMICPFTTRHNGKVERSLRKNNERFYAMHSSILFRILPGSLRHITAKTTITFPWGL